MFGYEPEFVDCGDARIACYDIGRGKPLVLLHGNGEDSSYWKAQIPELTRFYRVIAVDSRGHGASETGAQGLSFALMAEDLKRVLDARGVKKAHFLGFSDGGYAVNALLAKFSKKAARKRDVLGLMVHPYGVAMDDLAQLTMPVLIIVGEHDMVRESQTRAMAAHLPDCRVEVFRDGDHFVAAKQPSRFNRTVIEFLLGR